MSSPMEQPNYSQSTKNRPNWYELVVRVDVALLFSAFAVALALMPFQIANLPAWFKYLQYLAPPFLLFNAYQQIQGIVKRRRGVPNAQLDCLVELEPTYGSAVPMTFGFAILGIGGFIECIMDPAKRIMWLLVWLISLFAFITGFCGILWARQLRRLSRP